MDGPRRSNRCEIRLAVLQSAAPAIVYAVIASGRAYWSWP